MQMEDVISSKIRVRSAWKKFREYLPILTRKGFSIKLKGKVYATRVRSCLMHGSETWPMKVEQVLKMNRTSESSFFFLSFSLTHTSI